MLNDDILDNRYIVLLLVASFWFIMNSIFLVTVFAVVSGQKKETIYPCDNNSNELNIPCHT